MKKINIYLDDLRDCPENFEIARTVEKAKELIKNNKVSILSLDHDLGLDDQGNLLPTGYDFVKYFCEYGLYVDKIYIHTDNPIGRNSMYQTLNAAQKRGFIKKEIEIYNYGLTPNKYTERSGTMNKENKLFCKFLKSNGFTIRKYDNYIEVSSNTKLGEKMIYLMDLSETMSLFNQFKEYANELDVDDLIADEFINRKDETLEKLKLTNDLKEYKKKLLELVENYSETYN